MKILIGYDGSECSREAMEDLRRAGLPRQVDLLVVSVADMWPVLPDPENEEAEPELSPEAAQAWEEQLMAAENQLPAAVTQAREYALQKLEEMRAHMGPDVERIRAGFPGWNVDSKVIADSPYWGLTKLSDKWNADLLVVGSHGRSALGRMFLGSVSLNVVNYAHCSVRVVRCGLAPRQGPLRLLIGFDGSSHSEAAVRMLKERLWPEGSEVRLLAALEPKGVTFLPHADEENRPHEAWLRSSAERAAAELRAGGLPTEIQVIQGDPKRLLVEDAEAWGADSIFIGAKGLGGFKPLLLGSVATAVVSRAHCSVEVVRPPRTAPSAT